METVATREILWNLSHPANSVVMYALLAVALAVAGVGLLRQVEFWRFGKPSPENLGHWGDRMVSLLSWGLFQRGVIRERFAGTMHTLIYLGFLVLLFATTMVFIHHDLGIEIYQGDFYLFVTVISDIFGVALLFGCCLAAHRRYIQKADLVHNRPADALLLTALVLLVVQGYVLEGLRIHVTQDPWRWYSPAGLLVSKFFWQLSPASASLLHFGVWWFHTVTVMVVIACAPYSKFLHVIASSLNLFFKRMGRPDGALKSPGNLEKMMESGEEFSIGLGSIKDYSWKELLDLSACTSCGRCQEVCPAYGSGKPLSPKWMILDTRNHAFALHGKGALGESILPEAMTRQDSELSLKLMLSTSGLVKNGPGYEYADGGRFRASNPLVQGSARKIGDSSDDRISGEVMDSAVFWSCTTCMACVEACPVGINHVDHIVGNRRNMVLMQGEIPTEAQKTLRAIESKGNPYGPAEDRIKWLQGIEVPILKAGDSVDYLYWVGCVSAYDPRKQKIARALATIMKKAGLSFGILGNEEGCSGDPARRLGEENLFQMMAKRNMELLRSLQFKTLVANCPHCFNTIQNEYPQFGNLADGAQPEIIHHSVLLRRLIDEGKISVREGEEKITFHDPCYLGRYNKEYDAPRDVIRSTNSLAILEMDRSREKGMCCGAGGGHFWMDLKVGTRVNAQRADQAAATGADHVGTACPFCLQMMEDGVKLTNREGSMSVRDIAEIVAERME